MKNWYPYKGEIAVTVKKDGRFAFYIPPYAENLQNSGASAAAENGFFTVEAKAGQQLLLTFDLRLQWHSVGGKTRLMHGPLVLDAKGEADLAAIRYIGNGRYLADTTYLIPLNYGFRLPEAELMTDKIQVLF